MQSCITLTQGECSVMCSVTSMTCYALPGPSDLLSHFTDCMSSPSSAPSPRHRAASPLAWGLAGALSLERAVKAAAAAWLCPAGHRPLYDLCSACLFPAVSLDRSTPGSGRRWATDRVHGRSAFSHNGLQPVDDTTDEG